jgi:hypothetical protein
LDILVEFESNFIPVKLVALIFGVLFTITGAKVSLGPPVGDTTFAQRGKRAKTNSPAAARIIIRFNAIIII